jgi:hypothetical protein
MPIKSCPKTSREKKLRPKVNIEDTNKTTKNKQIKMLQTEVEKLLEINKLLQGELAEARDTKLAAQTNLYSESFIISGQ